MNLPNHWRPLAVAELQELLGSFSEWVLCGGVAMDLLLGRQTRVHGDIDIGVFRSRLAECLGTIGRDRVYLCSPPGVHVPWDGGDIDPEVHDIWICDPTRTYWVLQVMVFDDDVHRVYYRRNRRIHWSKESHSISVGGIRLLNPLIMFLYKTAKAQMVDKEIVDVIALIESASPTAVEDPA